MTILFDEDEIAKTNRLVRDKSQPITQDDVVARVRRHISMVREKIYLLLLTVARTVTSGVT